MKSTPVLIDRKNLSLNFDEVGHGNLNNNIIQLILMAKQYGMTVNGLRNLLVILYSLRSNQLHTPLQLKLFDQDFGDITKPTESTVTFSFYWKDFLEKGSKNYKKAEEGLVELASIGGKKEFKNEKNEIIRIYASIISDITVNEKQKGVRFNMNIAWYRMFLEITKYQKFSNRIIFGVPSINVIVWYFYLKYQPRKDPNTKKPIKYHDFTLAKINEVFNTNYKYWTKIEEKILKPARQSLNQIADISFHYFIKENKVFVEIYELDPSVPMTFESKADLQIARTITYQKKKSKLSLDEAMILESLYKKYGYEFVYKATVRRKSLAGLEGAAYVKEMHVLIMAAIQASN